MKLLDVTIQNFMSFGTNPNNVVVLSDAGITLIEGDNKDDESASSNGAAKSTIPHAVEWCLYGITSHEPSAEGDEVINRHTRGDCVVTVRFQIADGGTIYTCRRGRKLHKPLCDEFGVKVGASGLLLYAGEENQTKGTTKDTQEVLNKLIGLSQRTFRHAVLFGRSKTFQFTRLSDSDKKQVIDEMIGVQTYAQGRDAAVKAADLVQEDLDRTERELERLSWQVESARETLGKLKEQERTAEAEKQRALKQAASSVSDLEEKYTEARLKCTAGESAYTDKRDAAERALKDAEKAQRDSESALERVEADIAASTKRVDRMKKLEDTTCPTCEQPVTPAHVDALVRRIRAALPATQETYSKAQQRVSKMCDAVEAAQKAVRQAREAHQKYQDERQRLQLAHERAEAVKDKLEDARKALRKLREQTSDFSKLIEEENEKLQAAKKASAELKDKRSLFERRLATLRFWEEGFGNKGLRSLLLDSALPYLNAKLERYSNALTQGNITVQFQTQRELKSGGSREELHVAVTNRFGADGYKMQSIGERAKVDLIVGLALQDMASSRSRVPVNVAFFDEVFDGIDPVGVDRVVDVLTGLDRPSAFIITHQDSLRAYFSRTVKVVKRNGMSRIVKGS